MFSLCAICVFHVLIVSDCGFLLFDVIHWLAEWMRTVAVVNCQFWKIFAYFAFVGWGSVQDLAQKVPSKLIDRQKVTGWGRVLVMYRRFSANLDSGLLLETVFPKSCSNLGSQRFLFTKLRGVRCACLMCKCYHFCKRRWKRPDSHLLLLANLPEIKEIFLFVMTEQHFAVCRHTPTLWGRRQGCSFQRDTWEKKVIRKKCPAYCCSNRPSVSGARSQNTFSSCLWQHEEDNIGSHYKRRGCSKSARLWKYTMWSTKFWLGVTVVHSETEHL